VSLIRLAAVLCVAWLAAASPRAQADAVPPPAPAPAPAAAEPAPVPPQTIAAPDIVTRAEEAKALVRRIAERNAEDGVKREIESGLPQMSEKLRERTERADEMLELSPTIDAMNDLDNEWRTRAKRLTEWRLALTKNAQLIESDLAALVQEREIWERTRDAPEAAALPPATLSRVSETIETLARAQQKLQRQRSSILTLQNGVAEEELVVRGMVDRVAKQRSDLTKHLFLRDAPPLWSAQAYAPSGDPTFVPARMRAAVERKVDLLNEFASLSVSRLELEALFFSLVLGALLVARKRVLASAKAQSDPALAVPTRIVDRPISAALVVAIAATSWLLPRAPGVLSEAESLVILIPVLRLLPTELFGELRPGLIGLSLLFVAGSLRGFFAVVPTVERFLILPETIGTVGLLYWLQRPKHMARLRAIGGFGFAVVPVARVALLISVGAALCNVLGMVLLSRLLLRGVLTTAYAAVAIYALTRFAGGVVTALLRSALGRKLRLVRDHGELVRRRVLVIMQWIGALAWAVTSLRVIGLYEHSVAAVMGALSARLEVGTVSLSLGDVVAFVFTIWLTTQISRFLRFVLEEDVLPHVALPRGVPAAILTGVQYTILAAGFLIAIGAAGIDLSKFGLIAGALGVGIGFGLQNVVNNFVSGLILLFERPVQVGDTIEVGGLQGEVKRIGIRSSSIRTGEGADVIVPNAALIADRVVNWTFSDRTRRIDLEVGVAYGSDPGKVTAILLETARSQAEVLSLPEPVALFTRFAESALTFQVQVWCRVELGGRVRSELGIALHDALRAAGIEIPFPQRDLHVKVEPGAS
jgi:small-conductance mechanosensitive channel